MKVKKKLNTTMQCPFLKGARLHKKSFCSKSRTDSLLDTLFETRSTHALEECLKNDKNYQKRERKVDEILRKINRMGLNPEQKNAVDEALSIYNYQDFQYGRIAYGLGFRDAVHLIMEISAD